MLAINGVHPKVVQELAGHSDPQTTMSVYTHMNQVPKHQAADILAGALASWNEAVVLSAARFVPRSYQS